jgi:hypothetical protein
MPHPMSAELRFRAAIATQLANAEALRPLVFVPSITHLDIVCGLTSAKQLDVAEWTPELEASNFRVGLGECHGNAVDGAVRLPFRAWAHAYARQVDERVRWLDQAHERALREPIPERPLSPRDVDEMDGCARCDRKGAARC